MKKLFLFLFSLLFIFLFFFNFNHFKSTPVTASSSSPYIKGSITPETLYVISEDDMTKSEQTMIATLQGILSLKSTKQIYILSSSEPDYSIWLADLNKNYGVKYKTIHDPWILLKEFISFVNGYTLFTTFNPPSINNACTFAGLNNCLAIEEALESKVNSMGLKNLIKDCRNTDKYWAFDNLWNKGLNHSTVIEISPDKTMSLRDYGILSKALLFYEDDINDFSLRESIFKAMDTEGHCLGWGPDEHNNVSIASKYGIDITAADWSYNLSVLSSYPSTPKIQKTDNTFKQEDGVHYVTIVMSDGDNQQWMLGSNYNSKNYFASPYRGTFNLGWSINESLYYLAPTVFNKYYESASSNKYYDDFITAPSGNGYMYPSKFPINQLKTYTENLNEYMKNVNQNSVLILDDEALHKIDVWNNYTSKDNINGLFYLNYYNHNYYKGEIVWSNNKPIVSCRDLLWRGLESEDNLINNINNRINSGYTNIKSPDSYSFVYVHVWSNTMDNVNDLVNKLNQNPKVRIVTPSNFIKLIKENVIHN